ncbi:MAG: NAD(P)/FAD-dependent oxidoreductase [Treponemataceae bacterium]|nr:NAD(P)/FAD-dependent oxidoreductase [Treponemataceae bacterium]
MSKKAIIIGAGPAGLTAAYQLLTTSDIEVTIYEETDEIGGISKTVRYNGNRIDIGGHRFFSKSETATNFWFDLMPKQSAPAKDEIILGIKREYENKENYDPEKTDRLMLTRRRVSRIFFRRKFFDYPISMKPQTFINMGFWNTLRAGFGYMASVIHKRKENSLEDFYINRFGKPLYQMFFEDYTTKLWGVHPSNIAPDWGAQRVKGLSIGKMLLSIITKPFKKDKNKVETSLIEEFFYPKFGPGHFWETVAEEVEAKGGKIIKNTGICGLKLDNDRITELTINQNGEKTTVSADYIISSMPIKDLVDDMQGNVPEEVRHIAHELPYRDFITVGLLLDKLLIKNLTKLKTVNNIVPDTWIYVQERDVKIGRLQIFNNWSPYMVKDFENSVWIGLEYFCKEGDEFWQMSDEDFIKFAISELVKIDVIAEKDVKDSVRIKVKKAYPAYFGTYAQFDKVQNFLDKIENLYCVGRNGQHRYNNMDHSMLTAIEAVNVIESGSKDKSSIWNVNTEKEYHESKSST